MAQLKGTKSAARQTRTPEQIAEYKRRWYFANRERINEMRRCPERRERRRAKEAEWRNKNRERVRELKRKHRAKPEQKERAAIRAKRWLENNRDRVNAIRRAAYRANPKRKLKGRTYRQQHLERIREQSRRSAKNLWGKNAEKFRTSSRMAYYKRVWAGPLIPTLEMLYQLNQRIKSNDQG